jgi:hypothetical protein
MMSATISPAQFERVESQTWADFTAAAPAAAQRALGTARLDIGGGVALALPNDPTGFWNMTRGLGFAEPVTADLVQRVAAFYREHGASAARLHLLPQVLPPDWPDICARLNISDSGEVLVKLGGNLATVTERSLAAVRLDPALRIGRVGPDQAREFAEVTDCAAPRSGKQRRPWSSSRRSPSPPDRRWQRSEESACHSLEHCRRRRLRSPTSTRC